MPMQTILGQQIQYTQQGNGRHTLLLIHGAGGSHLVWPKEVRQLPDAVVYAVDLPGHGRSAPPGENTVEGYANFIIALLRELALTEVMLVGHSMGGAIAQRAAQLAPHRIAALVLIGTGARLPVSETLLAQTQNDFETAVAFINKYQWSPTAPDGLRQLAARQLKETEPAVLHADFVACNRFDMRDELTHLTMPALVIGGENDKMTPLKFSQFLATRLPQAQLVILPGAGHMMILEQPQAVAEAMRAFLTNLGLPEETGNPSRRPEG